MTHFHDPAATNEDIRRQLLAAFDNRDRGYMTFLLWHLFPDDCPTPMFVSAKEGERRENKRRAKASAHS
jgi:hypothetical protein